MLDIQQLPLAPELSMASLFAHFSEQNWAMLLDSADSQHEDGRFDIMVASPIATLVTKGDTSTLCYLGLANKRSTPIQSTEDPTVLLEQVLAELLPKAKAIDSNLPFLVGAMGYFGYDLGEHFEQSSLKSKAATSDYLAPDMAVGIYAWSLIKDNHNGIFYLASAPQHTAPQPSFWQALARKKQAKSTPFSLATNWLSNMSPDDYYQRFASIDEYLHAGDCYQVNLAQRFSADYLGSEWLAYKALREANSAPFSAFIRLPQCCVLSISPERFLSLKDGQVQTKPIKGTRPRSASKVDDEAHAAALLCSEKDRAENLMIVDLLRNDLSKNCEAGSVTVPKLFAIESFAAVHHLVSTVVAKLSPSSSALKLLRDAFPGGSITGAPKIRAMQIIQELEPHKRNIYCGSIGYIGATGDMDTSICIRTLLCDQGKIYCWAGGGIVVDSKAEQEYQECFDKVSKILPVLESLSPTLNDLDLPQNKELA